MGAARTILVGDVHGCPDELSRLLERARYAQGIDRLILVGDLVARGPDSAGAVARAVEFGAVAVRGNHDEKVLAWWRVARVLGRDEATRTVPLSTKHQIATGQLRDDQFAMLDALPLTIALPEHGVLVVHAGLDARAPLDQQDPHVLMNIRSIDASGRPTRKLVGSPWAKRWPGAPHVVFGHDARRGVQIEKHATGLDSGCCYGRELTALVLADNQPVPERRKDRLAQLVREPARAVYCPMGDGTGPE